MMLQRWEPFGELRRMDEALNRLWSEFGRSWAHWPRLFNDGLAVPIDIYETPDHVVVKAALPGLQPEEVDITITGQTLTIKGEHRAEEEKQEERYLLRERSYGTFSRTISLPQGLDTDKAEASYQQGVLTVHLPKKEQVKPKSIKVKASKS